MAQLQKASPKFSSSSRLAPVSPIVDTSESAGAATTLPQSSEPVSKVTNIKIKTSPTVMAAVNSSTSAASKDSPTSVGASSTGAATTLHTSSEAAMASGTVSVSHGGEGETDSKEEAIVKIEAEAAGGEAAVAEPRKISCEDIQLVQNLIERCMQLYMNEKEVITTLQSQAKIEPGFTSLVWQKLEEQNSDFFEAYYSRLKLKDQVILFNQLLEQHFNLTNKINSQAQSQGAAQPHLQPQTQTQAPPAPHVQSQPSQNHSNQPPTPPSYSTGMAVGVGVGPIPPQPNGVRHPAGMPPPVQGTPMGYPMHRPPPMASHGMPHPGMRVGTPPIMPMAPVHGLPHHHPHAMPHAYGHPAGRPRGSHMDMPAIGVPSNMQPPHGAMGHGPPPHQGMQMGTPADHLSLGLGLNQSESSTPPDPMNGLEGAMGREEQEGAGPADIDSSPSGFPFDNPDTDLELGLSSLGLGMGLGLGLDVSPFGSSHSAAHNMGLTDADISMTHVPIRESLAALGHIPRNFSLSDLASEFQHNPGDANGGMLSMSGLPNSPPYGVGEADHFLQSPRGQEEDKNLMETFNELDFMGLK